MEGTRNKKFLLIFAFILLAPLNNSFEVGAMMVGALPYLGWSLQLTPVYIKIYKDIFFLVVFLCCVYYLIRNKKFRDSLIYIHIGPLYCLLGSVVIAFLISLFKSEVSNAFLGLRSFFCLVYFFYGFILCDVLSRKKINLAIIMLLLLTVCFQVYQRVFQLGMPVFGELRSPGIFIVPAAAGFFSLICLHTFVENKSGFLFKVLAIVSSVLSTSTASIISLLFCFQYYISNRLYPRNIYARIIILLILLVGVGGFFIAFAGVISGRGAAVFETGMGRVNIFNNYFQNLSLENIIFGGNFGLATSAAMTSEGGGFVADNTFLSLFASLGVMGSLSFLFFLTKLYFLDTSKIIFSSFLFYSLTANIFELSPVSQLAFLFVGLLFGKAYMKKVNGDGGFKIYSSR